MVEQHYRGAISAPGQRRELRLHDGGQGTATSYSAQTGGVLVDGDRPRFERKAADVISTPDVHDPAAVIEHHKKQHGRGGDAERKIRIGLWDVDRAVRLTAHDERSPVKRRARQSAAI